MKHIDLNHQRIEVIDLLSKKEFSILDKTGSQTLKKDHIIFARIVQMGENYFIESTAPIVIPSPYLLSIVKFSHSPKEVTESEFYRIDCFLYIYL